MSNPKRFPFIERRNPKGEANVFPCLSIPLSGNLAPVEAKGLAVMGQVSDFPPTLLAFAWVKSNDPPLILGQLNFFLEFDVCFYRSQLAFDICPKLRTSM